MRPRRPQEAIAWLKYTYLYGRMTKNPLAYGITWETLAVGGRAKGAGRG